MEAGLDVRLRVLVPIVENAISADAFRPGDVLRSRKGLTVEIGNTDAEGRLILADALALADEEAPELLIDFATLTGAARVALGPDLPPFFTDDEALAAEIAGARRASTIRSGACRCGAPTTRCSTARSPTSTTRRAAASPARSRRRCSSRVSSTAAKAWAHFDIYAWNPKPRAHGPQGGEVQAARAVFELSGGALPPPLRRRSGFIAPRDFPRPSESAGRPFGVRSGGDEPMAGAGPGGEADPVAIARKVGVDGAGSSRGSISRPTRSPPRSW